MVVFRALDYKFKRPEGEEETEFEDQEPPPMVYTNPMEARFAESLARSLVEKMKEKALTERQQRQERRQTTGFKFFSLTPL